MLLVKFNFSSVDIYTDFPIRAYMFEMAISDQEFKRKEPDHDLKMLIRHIWAKKQQRQIQVHKVTAHILDNRCVEEKER